MLARKRRRIDGSFGGESSGLIVGDDDGRLQLGDDDDVIANGNGCGGCWS